MDTWTPPTTPAPADGPLVDTFGRIADAHAANPFILVSGGPRFEGAMIATAAQGDRGRFFYVLRASKLLSSSSSKSGSAATNSNSPSAGTAIPTWRLVSTTTKAGRLASD